LDEHDTREGKTMALGYDGKLYFLAFDHRGSFQKKMFGSMATRLRRRPSASQTPST